MSLADHIEMTSLLPEPFARWFAARGWTPRPHQLELLAKARAGRSVLLIAPTGAGKTLAGFLPSLVELSGSLPPGQSRSSPLARRTPSPLAGEGWGRVAGGDAVSATLAPGLATPTPGPSP